MQRSAPAAPAPAPNPPAQARTPHHPAQPERTRPEPQRQTARGGSGVVQRTLTDNAARYTPQNGALDIRIEAGPEKVRVDYTNNGGELSSEDLPFIFERFYRGEKSRSRQLGGAGIGLAIVKELVEAHGGRVGAELIGEQVRVWFELPITPAGRAG